MSRGKQPKLSASQRRHLLEPHDAGTHTQEELAELPDVLFGLRVMRKPLGCFYGCQGATAALRSR
jgi:hypothetical protein